MLCLMALFLCGIVLFVLLMALRLGGCQLLVMLVRLVAAYPDSAGDCGSEVLALGFHLVSRSSPVGKRFRLNSKTLHTSWGYRLILVHAFWEETASGGVFRSFHA